MPSYLFHQHWNIEVFLVHSLLFHNILHLEQKLKNNPLME